MKEKYQKFKILWANPKYKAMIKLGGWVVFFIIFFAVAAVTSKMPDKKVVKSEEIVNYTIMKNNLLNSNLNIKYVINNYYIEGIIKDNVLTGTLETNDLTTKIKYDGTNLYEVKKDVDTLNNNLMNDLNKNYLLPKYLINLLNSNESLMHQNNDNITYDYDINGIKISVLVNKKEITKVTVVDNGINYALNYAII